jgi:AraC-like DNA-binding protein
MKKEMIVSDKEFSNYKDLVSSATNWEHTCTYQLGLHALVGKHKTIELDDMQISYSEREGGMMHDVVSPKNSVSMAIIEECEAEACFAKIKLSAGDIIFFDDKKSYSFISKGKIKTVVLSINKHSNREIISRLSSLHGYILIDKDRALSKLLHQNEEKIVDTKEKILATVAQLIDSQEPVKAKLTKGEKVTFKILKDIYHHMDGSITIESLALKYSVSEKTLQNSFKSLFGFTPKIFLRKLKLNLVHHELKNSTNIKMKVSQVAMKWGFKHMGSFAKYYKELFGKNPSQTLKKRYDGEFEIDKSCVSRQEEME